MESFAFLLVLVPVALIALPIIALVTVNSRARELRAEMASLLDRIRDLEERLHKLADHPPALVPPPRAEAAYAPAPPVAPTLAPKPVPAATPPPTPSAPGPSAPTPPPASPPAPVTAPLFHSIEPAPTTDARSLENRIGSQWFNRIGILAVLIGVAWFLKLAFDNHWIGPLGRVIIGLLAGAALIVWSERFHHRGFAVFSFSLKAIGSGTLYLSLWAAFHSTGSSPPAQPSPP